MTDSLMYIKLNNASEEPWGLEEKHNRLLEEKWMLRAGD